MARPYKTRTAEQYAADQQRTDAARAVIKQSGLTMLEVTYHLGYSYLSLNRWLREGLSPERYRKVLSAVAAARAARKREGR